MGFADLFIESLDTNTVFEEDSNGRVIALDGCPVQRCVAIGSINQRQISFQCY